MHEIKFERIEKYVYNLLKFSLAFLLLGCIFFLDAFMLEIEMYKNAYFFFLVQTNKNAYFMNTWFILFCLILHFWIHGLLFFTFEFYYYYCFIGMDDLRCNKDNQTFFGVIVFYLSMHWNTPISSFSFGRKPNSLSLYILFQFAILSHYYYMNIFVILSFYDGVNMFITQSNTMVRGK